MQTVLLFTDEYALARQEIIQLGGTVDQKHHHSAMIVSLPRSISPSQLSYSSTLPPEKYEQELLSIIEAFQMFQSPNLCLKGLVVPWADYLVYF